MRLFMHLLCIVCYAVYVVLHSYRPDNMSTVNVEQHLAELARLEAARREWLRAKARLEPESLKWEAAFKAALPELMTLLDEAPEQALQYAFNMTTARHPAWAPEDVHPVDASRSPRAKAWTLSAVLAPLAALAAVLTTAIDPWLAVPAAAAFTLVALWRAAEARRDFVAQEEARTGHLYAKLCNLKRMLTLQDARNITPTLVAMLAASYRPRAQAKAANATDTRRVLSDEELEGGTTAPAAAHQAPASDAAMASGWYAPAPQVDLFPYGTVNPASGLPMTAGSSLDVGGNAWGMNQ